MITTTVKETVISNPALVLACAANPDDDLPQLVYADWLDEHGSPHRANFRCIDERLPEVAFYASEKAGANAVNQAALDWARAEAGTLVTQPGEG